jgi:2,3-bisphosphoglycerate-independent phosphoglycerate mutase
VTENKDVQPADGILADVAPSVLKIMGLPVPAEMTGKQLI